MPVRAASYGADAPGVPGDAGRFCVVPGPLGSPSSGVGRARSRPSTSDLTCIYSDSIIFLVLHTQRDTGGSKVAGSKRAAGERRQPDDPERTERAAEVLRALAHPVRVEIVRLLGEGELCVKRIEEILGVPQPSVSQHLARLKYAGVIESERRGHLVCYRLRNTGAADAVDAVVNEE
ncbi:MAG: metalloregulator ArsR/SmtB family transcription factor [Candidatus Eisenbacteria bacterium]|nr:metalloregulator ArsR/SmtB family transcription factor [Candidatus Eisenbacteria bacterium]